MLLLVIFPIISVTLTSLTRTDLIGKQLIPDKLVLSNYYSVLFRTPFLKYMWNTIYIGVVIAFSNCFINSLSAYAFARMHFPFKNLIFYLLIGTLIIPGEVTILPLYMLMRDFHWIDSHIALIIPKIASIFWIFFLRQYFLGLPNDLESAAKIDGASWFQTYFRIILPLIKAPLFTSGLLLFFGVWDEFLWPITVINSSRKHLVQVAVTVLDNENYIDVGAKYANVMLCAIPTLILFMFVQRQYIAGVTEGSMKA
jgi:multiple sugar transport system permease protein